MSKAPLTICLLGSAVCAGIGVALKTDMGTGMIIGAIAVLVSTCGLYIMNP